LAILSVLTGLSILTGLSVLAGLPILAVLSVLATLPAIESAVKPTAITYELVSFYLAHVSKVYKEY